MKRLKYVESTHYRMEQRMKRVVSERQWEISARNKILGELKKGIGR